MEEGKYQPITQRMLEGYQRDEPPYVLQLVVPITVPQQFFKAALLSTGALVCTIGCLDIIAFFYLLCVGKYTTPRYVIRGGKLVRAT